ncbi:hypothetical protein [Vulcanococcus limneticus]|uniref:hypothetical protein n=1 Tax=Vulcanococcus limneticus TaxID=2170428 RepID=UPI00398BD60F
MADLKRLAVMPLPLSLPLLSVVGLAALLGPQPARAGLGDKLQQWIDRPGYQRSQCLALQEGRLSYQQGLVKLGIEPSTRANAHLYALCREVGAPFFASGG